MTTQAVPLTVAPVVGCVIATWSEPVGAGVGVGVGVGVGSGVGAGIGLAFAVFTLAVPLPVLPVESFTPMLSVWDPFASFVVSIGIDTGPLLPVCVPIVWPSTPIVKMLLTAVLPCTHPTAHDVPLSVGPEVGCLIATVKPLAGPGLGDRAGGGAEVMGGAGVVHR